MKLNTAKIYHELDRLEWSQSKFANEAGISKQLLSFYLRRRCENLSAVEKLARALKLDPKDLLI
jgi:transcriptional regulator with XRE-family HTH domain